ncbi:MAG: hypothetical protein ACI35Q_11390 [Marinilabiliaceae bacterium]
MRTLFTAALLAVSAFAFFTACDKEEDGPRGEGSRLYINGKDRQTTNKAATGALTVREILRNDTLWLRGRAIDREGETLSGQATHAAGTIDTVNQRIIREALEANFFDEFHNYVITDNKYPDGDTLAYIPNDTVKAAYERIYVLREQGRWNELYEVFQNAFVFYPCTGAEYRELAAKGLN